MVQENNVKGFETSAGIVLTVGAITDGEYLKRSGTNIISGTGGLTYTDRGDSSAWDWTQATLTIDTVFHDLDLSSIIPSGTVLVHLRLMIKDNLVGLGIEMRKNGNANAYNAAALLTKVANLEERGDFWLVPDANRIVEYLVSVGMDEVGILVRGWFVPA